MPRPTDLNAVINALVSANVNAALAPYRDVLERMAKLVGQGPARRPGLPAKAAAPAEPRRRRARRGSKAKRLAHGAGLVSPGQKVQFRQGRGLFEAKVVEVDAAGIVTIERASDGKKFVRASDTLVVG